MNQIQVEGGRPLNGDLVVQGAKNSVLPILAATILSGGVCQIQHCPALRDVDSAIRILQYLGCRAHREGDELTVDTAGLSRCDIPEDMMREMRSSVIFLGAILARLGRAEMSYPGGCELGPRPIDFHLAALRTLGTDIDESTGVLRCSAAELRGGEILLSLPSVGATENTMLAACGAEGTTVIHNAAREPEIVDLQNFLQKMGASVHGAGSSTVVIQGKRPLHGCCHQVIADRIAAATYLCAGAAAGGEICLRQVDYRHLSTVTTALTQAGCRVRSTAEEITLQSDGHLRSITPVRTSPYPGFPTDAQALLMAALLKSQGTTVFVENIFESRYRHVAELQRMGADIRIEGRVAVVCGVSSLHGAMVQASDLRGGAALVVAGLQTGGTTLVGHIQHIQRGYSDFVENLARLGAHITTTNT